MIFRLSQVLGGADDSINGIYYGSTFIDTDKIWSFSTNHNIAEKTIDFIVNGRVIFRGCYFGVYDDSEDCYDKTINKIHNYFNCLSNAIIKSLIDKSKKKGA